MISKKKKKEKKKCNCPPTDKKLLKMASEYMYGKDDNNTVPKIKIDLRKSVPYKQSRSSSYRRFYALKKANKLDYRLTFEDYQKNLNAPNTNPPTKDSIERLMDEMKMEMSKMEEEEIEGTESPGLEKIHWALEEESLPYRELLRKLLKEKERLREIEEKERRLKEADKKKVEK